jgi:hypothetical protein
LIVGLLASLSMMVRRTLARSGLAKVRPRCWHSLTSNGGSPSAKLTKSRRAFFEWLSIGKIEVKAACSPSFLRFSGGTAACRNAVKESSCVARRNGTFSTPARLAKLLRIRFFSVEV